MNRQELLALFVKGAADELGKPIAEMAKLLSDKHQSDNILDLLGIDFGNLCRIIDRIEPKLGIALPTDVIKCNTCDNLLNAMVLAMKREGYGEDAVNPEQADDKGESIADAIGGGLMTAQLTEV